jgi:chromosome segregation ATPase
MAASPTDDGLRRQQRSLEELRSLMLEDSNRLAALDCRVDEDLSTERILRHQNELLLGGIEQLKLRISNKSKELNRMGAYLSRSRHSLAQLRLRYDELTVERDKLQQICDQSHQLLSDVQDLGDRRTRLEAEISRLEQNKRTNLLTSELQSLESQQAHDGARAAQIAATIDAQTARISALASDQLALKSKLSVQEEEFPKARRALRDRISRLQSAPQPRVEQLCAESADCDLAMRRLKAERRRSEGPLAAFREKRVVAKARIKLNERLRQKLESMNAEIKSDRRRREAMGPENEVRIGSEIAEMREALTAVRHRRKQKRKKVEAIREEAAGLKAEAAQLQEDLHLVESVLERQQREKGRIVGALRAFQVQLAE